MGKNISTFIGPINVVVGCVGLGLAFVSTVAASTNSASFGVGDTRFEVLHEFDGTDGRWGVADLVEGSDDVLYGVSQYGGSYDNGTIFSLGAMGEDFQLLHQFSTTDGWPLGLIQARDGLFYGTMARNFGTFVVRGDGSAFALVRSVAYFSSDAGLLGPLWEGVDGSLIGAAEGYSSFGALGRMSKDGSNFTLVHHFTDPALGLHAQPPLVVGRDGRLYGVAGPRNQNGGGSGFGGQFFRLDADGSGYTNLLDLGAMGYMPSASLLAASDGAFYGVAGIGYYSHSVIWRVGADGSGFAVLREFDTPTQGELAGRLLEGPDERLYGTLSGRFPCPTSIVTLDKDGGGFGYVWSEVFSVGKTNALAGFQFLKNVRENSLCGTAHAGGQTANGTLVRVWPGSAPTAPVVLAAPSDRFVPAGSRVAAAVALRGAGPMRLQWSLNGTAMADATNSWILLPAITAASLGAYSLTASNEFGSVSVMFHLDAPRLSGFHQTSNGWEFAVTSSPGLQATLESSFDLQKWEESDAVQLLEDDGKLHFTVLAAQAPAFYRTRYCCPVDDLDMDR